MAHPALARDEAAARADLVAVQEYDIELDLTTSDTTFASTSTVTFTCTTPGSDTWIDLVAPNLVSATLNGAPIDVSGYTGQRLPLPALAAENTLVVVADCAYSRTGEGLHRLVDPVDDEVYLYSQFEMADAQRVYACFDQPDLKAVYTFHVTAPDHWQVVSNAPTPPSAPVRAGVARWDFPTTARMSTYITALVAGAFHVVRDEYTGPHGTYPLGVFCRTSMAPYLDADRILEETKQGFAFFEDAFGHPYPFGKYDQLFVPEYNAGAMENAGCVTFDGGLRLPVPGHRGRLRAAGRTRSSTSSRTCGSATSSRCVGGTTSGSTSRSRSGPRTTRWPRQRSTPTRGPGSASSARPGPTARTSCPRPTRSPPTCPDLETVKLNFDGITYAKGASALRQLVAWVGEEEFFDGLRAYFQHHKWGNTVLSDLLVELEATSGRDLSAWTQQWLRTPGVNLLRPEVVYADPDTYATVAIVQEPPQMPPGLDPMLRSHRLRVGLYDLVDGRLTRTEQLELDVVGARTELPQLTGRPASDLLLINDDDLTFAKIRLGGRSSATAIAHIGDLAEPMPRSLVWAAAWDMTRDAEWSADDYLQLALSGLPAESDIGVVQKVLLQARTAIELFAAPDHRDEYRQRLAKGVGAAMLAAAPGSDLQLAYARAAITLASTTDAARPARQPAGGLSVRPRACRRHRPALVAPEPPRGHRASRRPGDRLGARP